MDRQLATDYVLANFEPSDRLAVVVLNKQTGAVTQRITTAERIAANDFQAWLRYQNAQRSEIYISMNALRSGAIGRTKADVGMIRHLYLDFDHNGTEAVENLSKRLDLPEPNYRLSTSPDKWQVVWKVGGFTPDAAERLQKSLAKDHLADPAATDSARVLRLPGFYNHKYAPPHLVIADFLSDRVHGPEDFPAPNLERTRAPATHLKHPAKRDETGLSQSEHDFAFAKRALYRGTSEQAVIAAIAQFRFHDKHDPGYYAAITVQKAKVALALDRTSQANDRLPEPER